MGNLEITDVYIEFPFENDNYLLVIAMMDKKIVGTAKVECWGNGGGFHPFVSKVWVSPEIRHQGVGRKLMNHVIEKAAENQNLTLALYVHMENMHARRLYQNLGFFAVTMDNDFQIMYAKQLSQQEKN